MSASIKAFTEADLENDDNLIVVDCYTPQCGPCKKLLPHLEKLNHSFKEQKAPVKIRKLNCHEELDLAHRWEIESVPTFILLRNGEKVAMVVPGRGDIMDDLQNTISKCFK